MGNKPSTQGSRLSHIEVVFSSSGTIATGLSMRQGSVPVIVSPSLRQVTLTLEPSIGKFLPLSASQPAKAVDLMFQALQTLPEFDQEDWTQNAFVAHIPKLEVIHERSVFVGFEKGEDIHKIMTSPGIIFVRLQYNEEEKILLNLLTVLKEILKTRNTTRLYVHVPEYQNTRLIIEANFTPSDPTIFTEPQLKKIQSNQKNRTNAPKSSTALVPATIPSLIQGGASTVEKLVSIGTTLRSTFSTIAPLLANRGITIPNLGTSPMNPEQLMVMLNKIQPFLEMFKNLGINK
jgi:hypothetical protein